MRSAIRDGVFAPVTIGLFQTSYSDSTASPGTTYFYRVVAVNAAGESDNSMIAAGAR